MIEIGIFGKTYPRATLEETLDAVAQAGIRTIQFNFQLAGLDSMPREMDKATIDRVQKALRQRSLHVHAVSGTFNMIHPDPAIRSDGLERLETLARFTRQLGTDLITVCSGTRDPINMWRRHPENDSASAWDDLLGSMERALTIAAHNDVRLGIEPETGNVVSSAAKARMLLDTLRDDRVGIIYDPANLIEGVDSATQQQILEEAFALLESDIVSVHGKDRNLAGDVVPVGKGVVPWTRVLENLSACNYNSPIMLHGLEELEFPGAFAYLSRLLAASGTGRS